LLLIHALLPRRTTHTCTRAQVHKCIERARAREREREREREKHTQCLE
jgi:hypothetical protein